MCAVGFRIRLKSGTVFFSMFVIFFIKVVPQDVLGEESRYAKAFFVYLFLNFCFAD